MLLCVCRGHLDAESCGAFWDDWVAEDEDVVIEECFGHRDRFRGVSYDDGADRCWGFEHIEIGLGFDLLAAVLHDIAELLRTLRLIHQRADRGVGARGDSHWECVAE